MFPEVKWVSVATGTREQGDIEDKAARYLPEQHMLLINADSTRDIGVSSFVK